MEESRVWLNKIVAKPNVESEVVILDSFKNRFRNRANIELMIAAKPAIGSNDSPTDAFLSEKTLQFDNPRAD